MQSRLLGPDTSGSGDVGSVHRDPRKNPNERPSPSIAVWQLSKASSDADRPNRAVQGHLPVKQRLRSAMGRIVYALWKRGAKGQTFELSIGGPSNMPVDWDAMLMCHGADGDITGK